MQLKGIMNRETKEIILEELEGRIEPLRLAQPAATVPSRGWLRAVREAIGLTQGRVAERAAVKRQSYSQFEAAEARGSISLASLRRVAGAMDCELVYFIVPRDSVARTYSGLAEIHDPLARHLRATDHSIALRGTSKDKPT
jgi:predicted DNA-binding mobile mystery protein A